MRDMTAKRTGWPILRAMLMRQRAGLLAGMVIGLVWSAGKVAVPILTREAIDTGINGDKSLKGYCYENRKVFCVMYFQTKVPC